MDELRSLEINVGAALNDADAVEELIDNIFTEVIKTGQIDELRKIAIVRHFAYQIRLIFARILDGVERKEFNPADALQEIRRAREYHGKILRWLLDLFPDRDSRTAQQASMIERVALSEYRIIGAIRSIEARLENSY